MRYTEICHYSHPQHSLKLEFTQLPFKCDGCKEFGIGNCYKCCSCNYDLHMHCALPTSSIYHPFYPKCTFIFMSNPPGDIPRYCNACERLVTGFLYHCNSCGFDLHPCCAKLPTVLDAATGMLYLYKKVSGPCQRCGKKGRSWTYRSSDKKYNLHVACVKDMLIESWHELYYGPGHSTTTTIREPNMIINVPGLKGALLQIHSHSKYNSSKSKGKVQKCCEMAGMTLQFVISAVLGDPTSLIAGVVGSLMTR